MMEEPGRGQVITFYSYKGGTGRSMALANIACLLATEQAAKGGKPVLAIDWDLEAPGLDRYFEPFLLGTRGQKQDGLIEVFADLRSRVRPGCAPDEEEEMSEEAVAALDLKRFAIPTSYPKLSFIRAGHSDDTYSTRTNTFDWQDLFSAAPSLFRMLADRLAEEFSYVLIDSRTGITDTSGICTTLMPEKLVLVFTPNRQSLTGLTDLVKRAYAYRRGSDDVRPLVVYPLPSRIETSVPEEMKRWRLGDAREEIRGWELQFTELLREVYELPETFTLSRYFDDVQAQHVPPYAYGEPIAVLRERGSERLTLTKSYDTFRGYLVRKAPWDEEVSLLDEAARQATLEQLDRLNEEFRAATEAVRPQPVPGAYAPPPPAPYSAVAAAAPPPARVTPWWRLPVQIGGMLLVLLALFLLVMRFYSPGTGSSARLSLVIAEAENNRPSTTVLLLAALLDEVGESEKSIALEQLRTRLARIPAPLFRMPVANAASMSLLGDRLLVLGGDGSLSRFDTSDGRRLPVVGGSYAAAAERPDGTIVAVTEGGVLTICDGDRVIAREQLDKRGLFRFGPHGKMLVHSTTGGEAAVWSIVQQRIMARRLYSLADVDGFMPGGAFSRDGETVVVVHRNGAVVVSATRQAVVPVAGSRTVVVSGAGSRIALVSGGRTVVYDAATRKELSTLPAMPILAIDPEGETLMGVVPVNTVARFDAKSGDQIGALPYTTRDVRGVDFLDDGRVVTTFADRIDVGQPLALRDVATIEPLGQMRESEYDGPMIVVATDDSVTGFRVDTERLDANLSGDAMIAEVCRRVGRDLTSQEWTTYFGSAKKEPVCQTRNQEKTSK